MQPPSSKRPYPAEWKAGRRGTSRPKKVKATEDNAIAWRLVDDEFDRLHKEFNFTVEACCDPQGLNGHASLPYYYSTHNSFLDNDVSGHTIFLNAPWKIAHKCMQHIRECHSTDPEGTKAVIILLDWQTFKELPSDSKLLRTIPGKQQIFTKSPDNDASLRTPVESI